MAFEARFTDSGKAQSFPKLKIMKRSKTKPSTCWRIIAALLCTGLAPGIPNTRADGDACAKNFAAVDGDTAEIPTPLPPKLVWLMKTLPSNITS